MRRPEPELTAALVAAAVVTVVYVGAATKGPVSSSETLGHGLGIVGFLLMIGGTFGYSWRKWPGRPGPGSLHRWMQAHVFTGLVGGWMTLLHGAFSFRGVAGVTAGLVAMVVATGFVGRSRARTEPELEVAVETRVGRATFPGEPRIRGRGVRSAWWLLHVPVALAMFALGVIHVLAVLYYAVPGGGRP